MRAIVLVGGEGTRLRPLTLGVPKAVVPVVNRPMMFLVLQWLRENGITEAVLSACYKPDVLKKVIGGRFQGMKIDYIFEETPLGTGGAIKRAEKFIDGTTLVMNGDIITSLDIKTMLRFHRAKKSRVTIALTPVDNPSAYGVVETKNDGSIVKFLEKPSLEEIAGKDININAGVYLIEPGMPHMMQNERIYSVERDIFPKFINNSFYGYIQKNIYWMDLGTVQKYAKASRDILDGTFKVKGLELTGRGVKVMEGARVLGPAAIGEGTVIGEKSRVGEFTVIGKKCRIGKNVVLDRCIMWDNVTIGDNCIIQDCVLAEGVKIGSHASVSGDAVLGAGSVISAYSRTRA